MQVEALSRHAGLTAARHGTEYRGGGVASTKPPDRVAVALSSDFSKIRRGDVLGRVRKTLRHGTVLGTCHRCTVNVGVQQICAAIVCPKSIMQRIPRSCGAGAGAGAVRRGLTPAV